MLPPPDPGSAADAAAEADGGHPADRGRRAQ